MTEKEWLACKDPRRLLMNATMTITQPRKYRLFCCEYCRSYFWDQLPAILRDAVATAEAYADGLASKYKLRKAQAAFGEVEVPRNKALRANFAAQLATSSVNPFVSAVVLVEKPATRPWRVRKETIAGLVREIFPFQPISFDPSWLTSTVSTLAHQIYDSRDFSAMPILADALQDAGCTNQTILEHCRGPGPHAKGCWALDLVLNRD